MKRTELEGSGSQTVLHVLVILGLQVVLRVISIFNFIYVHRHIFISAIMLLS